MLVLWAALGAALPGQAVPPPGAPIEARIAAMLQAVQPARLEATVRKLESFGTRHVLADTTSTETGTGAARAWLQREYEALIPQGGGRLSVQRQEATVPCTRPGMPREVAVVNIVATLRGTTDPDRIYLVGGHYDSRNGNGADGRRPAPGANDDGSGTAAALEACRVMCSHEFPATLVFVAYDGEEQGLIGSKAHADALAAANARVDGMITCDIVGNTLGMDGQRHAGHLRCFSYAPTGNDSSGRSLARAATFASARHLPDFGLKLIFRGDRYGRGGDHRSFFDQGYPAVRFTEPREDFSRQHQDVVERDGRPYGDVADFVDFAYLGNVTRTVVATLAELASAPPPPLVRSAQLRRDRYDTEVGLQLAPGTEDFELVWRETTAADWQGAVARADAQVREGRQGLVATLPGVCLDDVVVGVRAIGKDGSRSRVATPPEPDRFSQRPREDR